jgi:hypothetical protein
MKYDKQILTDIQISNVKRGEYASKNITIDDAKKINQLFLGGGMSQNYFALPIFEHYYDVNRFDYVVEFGSQKGSLSVYFANLASVTEGFFFETYELFPDTDWYVRENGGCGHWFDKLKEISPYVNSYHKDVFCDEVVEHIKDNIQDNRTFIFCDGGNKIKEFHTYAPLLKSGDCIAVHDWGVEIGWEQIKDVANANGITYDEPFASTCNILKTQIMPFRKI